MSATDVLAENFQKQLREIPVGTPLPELQSLYRKVIFSTGMQILQRFPGEAVAASQGGNPHPHMECSVTELAAFALCIRPSGQD
jgi:hypothetical protein